jgi:hypothetical protein
LFPVEAVNTSCAHDAQRKAVDASHDDIRVQISAAIVLLVMIVGLSSSDRHHSDESSNQCVVNLYSAQVRISRVRGERIDL